MCVVILRWRLCVCHDPQMAVVCVCGDPQMTVVCVS